MMMLMSTGQKSEVKEVGVFTPKMEKIGSLGAGDVGYIVSNVKDTSEIKTGDTITLSQRPATEMLPGYKEVRPMVFCGLYPVDTSDYEKLKAALGRLRLNDAAFVYSSESSVALGFGFRCGFLGLLHMEIIQERIRREHDVDIISTYPSVVYKVVKHGGDVIEVDNPVNLPDPGTIEEIREPTINRPGLALSGFFSYFAEKRVQVLGAAENTYLKSLSPKLRVKRFRALCEQKIPCVVISRGAHLDDALMAVAQNEEIAVFRTPMITMKFINAATIALEVDFSPTVTEFGSMVDILGIGVLIRGVSGIGKSESVLQLIERGYSLVADDVTRITSLEGRELMATAPQVTRYHMEVRGIGIINVASVFGIGAIRVEKRLDLVVTLKDWSDTEEVDRTGLDREFYEILDIKVPHVTIPVRPGRDLARLIEVAAMDQKLKSLGSNAALEFNTKLLNLMETKSPDGIA